MKRQDTPPRICEHCGAAYFRKRDEVPWAFRRRRFCSYACAFAPKPFDWARFDALIERSANDDCWPWRGRLSDKGYGIIWKDGRPQGAHRISYERATGQPLGELDALHQCDNPPCCNPAHLFPGTQADNNRDRDAKGRTRSVRGEDVGGAKLTEAQVRAIAVDRRIAKEIAADLGISKSTVHAIKCGHNWRHLGLDLKPSRQRLSATQRDEIRQSAKPISVLASEYGVSRLTVYRAKGKVY